MGDFNMHSASIVKLNSLISPQCKDAWHLKLITNGCLNKGEENFNSGNYVTYKRPKKKFETKLLKKMYNELYKRKQKTELCVNWIATGKCKFGKKCSFAHEINELRKKENLDTGYKTKQCEKFMNEMICPYGPRCKFIHCIYSYENQNKLSYRQILKINEDYIIQRIDQSLSTEKSIDDKRFSYISEFKRNRLSTFIKLCQDL